MRKLGLLFTATSLLTLAVFAPGAAAYSEFGNDCAGDATEPGWTVIGLSNGQTFPALQSDAGPHELRGGDGAVITRWKVNLAPGMGPLAQQLIAFRQIEGGVVNVGESAVETLVDGTNEFPTRIPVPEYARIGLRGPVATLFCDARENHILGVVEGAFPPGESRSYSVLLHKGVPAIATVERDEDNDGYGDETQDQCPSSALSHGPCLNVLIDARVVEKRRGAILVGVTTNVDTRIEVRGEAIWPRWGRTLKGVPKRIVKLSGGIQQMAPGVTAVFRVPLPKAVIKKLHKMLPRERLKLTMSAARLDRLEELPGQVTRVFTVKLPGRARPSAQR